MIVDYQNKLVFISNPKNASTSIEDCLKKLPYCGVISGHPWLKHMTFKTFQEIKKPLNIDDYITWCVIRSPVEKLISWYNYRSRNAIESTDRYLGDKTFSEFIGSISSEIKNECNDFNMINDGCDQVDIVFDYSNISELQKFLAMIYGIEALPQLNTSLSYRQTYSPNKNELQLAERVLSREIEEYSRLEKFSANEAVSLLNARDD